MTPRPVDAPPADATPDSTPAPEITPSAPEDQPSQARAPPPGGGLLGWLRGRRRGTSQDGSLGDAAEARARVALHETAQAYVDFIAQGDQFTDKLPDAFLVLGTSDLRTYLEFARHWNDMREQSGRAIPIVLAGGRGRGTIPLIQQALAHYRGLGTLAPEEDAWLEEAITNEGVTEVDLLRFILERELDPDIPENVIRVEVAPSGSTPANFLNSQRPMADASNGDEPCVRQPCKQRLSTVEADGLVRVSMDDQDRARDFAEPWPQVRSDVCVADA